MRNINVFLALSLLAGTGSAYFYGSAGASGRMAAPSEAQSESGGVLAARDADGNTAVVYNLFDGQNHMVQVTLTRADGAALWTRQHMDNMNEKAYSTAMDGAGNIFVAGSRRMHGRKYMLVLKFTADGFLHWEIADDRFDCTGTHVAVNEDGQVLVAGVCRDGDDGPIRVLKLSSDGGRYWAQEYGSGARNYTFGLQPWDGGATVSLKAVQGDSRSGSFTAQDVYFDSNGNVAGVR